jgi:mono/diheme cytochrome c family protein
VHDNNHLSAVFPSFRFYYIENTFESGKSHIIIIAKFIKMKLYKILTITFALVLGNIVMAAPPDEGKKIFTTRCAACHTINKQLVGPALGGVDTRHDINWIISFVKSSQIMINKGDKDAVVLFTKFNRVPMPNHPDLTDNNIKDIIAYIKAETQKAVVTKKNLRKAKTSLSPQVIFLAYRNNIFLILISLITLAFTVITVLLLKFYYSIIKRKGFNEMRID